MIPAPLPNRIFTSLLDLCPEFHADDIAYQLQDASQNRAQSILLDKNGKLKGKSTM